MDSGFNQALEIVQLHIDPYLQTKMPSALLNDFKSLLQIYSQQSYKQSPQYRVLNESGPDHDKWFQASVTIGEEVKGLGWGKSKKEAEQEAAKDALKKFEIRSTKSETNPNVLNTNDKNE